MGNRGRLQYTAGFLRRITKRLKISVARAETILCLSASDWKTARSRQPPQPVLLGKQINDALPLGALYRTHFLNRFEANETPNFDSELTEALEW